MKILLYNIDHGGKVGENQQARWPVLIKTIKKINPDIAILLECWDWRQELEFKKFAGKLGYEYYYLSTSNTRHHIGLISKIKPAKVTKHRKGFHHSVLQAKFSEPLGLTVFGIHLSPKTETIRLKESKKLIALFKKNEPAIMVGDFNSLSPLDCYQETKMIKKFKQQNLIKFGQDRLEKRVISGILRSGLIDIFKDHHRGKKLHYSVPSLSCKDAEHAVKMRLDYAFVSKKLAGRITASRLIKDQLTDKSSDHYPLLLTLK